MFKQFTLLNLNHILSAQELDNITIVKTGREEREKIEL